MDHKFQAIGHYIQTLRKSHRWTQQDVASRLNITTAAVSKIEAGMIDIRLSRLEQLGSLYNLSVVELIMNQQMAAHDYTEKLENFHTLLREKEVEVLDLQRRLINLYEKLHASKKKQP